jgi:tRNA nucleotidyltransferase (CCA-adding enzyme)
MKKLSHKGILRTLRRAGFKGYLVGGCVRDKLLQKLTKKIANIADYDIATNATPEEVISLFNLDSDASVGKKFCVVLVNGYEVATFRGEVYNVQGKPDVAPVSSFYLDSKRRDFTINAFAETIKGEIIDYHGGLQDLKNGIIRAVGNPLDRFNEDASRILRAFYFALKRNFTIETKTFQAIIDNPHLLKEVPDELIGKYIQKVMDCGKLSGFLKFLIQTNTLNYVFPELAHTIGMPQNPKYHDSNVSDHIIRVIESAERRFPNNTVLALSALLHDNMKGAEGIRNVNAEGQPNDLGHEEAGALPAENAVLRLQFGKETALMVKLITMFHGLQLPSDTKDANVIRFVKKLVPYFKNREELLNGLNYIFDFKLCDSDGFQKDFSEQTLKEISLVRNRLTDVLSNYVLYRSELAINGDDLISVGIKGQQIGELFDTFIANNMKEKSQILSYMKRKYNITFQE